MTPPIETQIETLQKTSRIGAANEAGKFKTVVDSDGQVRMWTLGQKPTESIIADYEEVQSLWKALEQTESGDSDTPDSERPPQSPTVPEDTDVLLEQAASGRLI
ncbi:hypothetical protein EXS54_01160 [Patescibacteria group bacterium]|nr:hypothetical protein [Patescibacteria group bacterium]